MWRSNWTGAVYAFRWAPRLNRASGQGLLPFGRSAANAGDDGDRDEERRLAYVALSRSQVQVYLTWCRTRLKDPDGAQPRRELRQPSRFVRALPPKLVHPIGVPKS